MASDACGGGTDQGDTCSNCGEEFGFDIGWDDPPEGDGYIEVTWNPADEPSFVVGETHKFCSFECLNEDDKVPAFANGGQDNE
jgi:hypothetical protein